MSIRYIIGIDEAGRGPLAGPLAVGGICVSVNADIKHEYFKNGIKDSKKLTALQREKLFEWIQENNLLQHAVAFAPVSLIDTVGVTIAINKALEGVLAKLVPKKCDFKDIQILLDGGLKAPEYFTNQRTIIKGDENEVTIALASVAAKVVRDRRMEELDKEYPQYGFAQHKGYGTKMHFEMLQKHGMCPEHRRRFLKKWNERMHV